MSDSTATLRSPVASPFLLQNVRLIEWHLYGSASQGRVAISRPDTILRRDSAWAITRTDTTIGIRRLRYRDYELKDHLGNVRVTITDMKMSNPSGSPGASPFTADLRSYQHSYPFGMPQPGRVWNGDSARSGYNGKEKDNEANGSGNEYDYGFRVYNPRLGRFLSVDPLAPEYPELTPYQYASNSPEMNIDRDGEEGVQQIDNDQHTTTLRQTWVYVLGSEADNYPLHGLERSTTATWSRSRRDFFDHRSLPESAIATFRSAVLEYFARQSRINGPFRDPYHVDPSTGVPFDVRLEIDVRAIDLRNPEYSTLAGQRDFENLVGAMNAADPQNVLIMNATTGEGLRLAGGANTGQIVLSGGRTTSTQVETIVEELLHTLTDQHPNAPPDLKAPSDRDPTRAWHRARGGIFSDRHAEGLTQQNIIDCLRSCPAFRGAPVTGE